MEEQKFSITEIRNYLQGQDSLGDIHYNLSAENVRKANEPKYPIVGEGEE